LRGHIGKQLLARAAAAVAHDALPAGVVDLGERAVQRLDRLIEQPLAETGRLLVLAWSSGSGMLERGLAVRTYCSLPVGLGVAAVMISTRSPF